MAAVSPKPNVSSDNSLSNAPNVSRRNYVGFVPYQDVFEKERLVKRVCTGNVSVSRNRRRFPDAIARCDLETLR
jgi:hypothetical protein